MTGTEIEYRFEPVFAFVQSRVPGLLRRDDMVAIGLMRRGVMVAGVVFENMNRFNAWVHVAAVDGGHWLTRRAALVPFLYAFKVCQLRRLSGYIDASNTASRRFAERMGFRQEAVLPGAAQDGGDVLIYVLLAKECRYVDSQ